MKKTAKIISALVILLFLILVLTPIFFKKQIKAKIITEVNNTINAQFTIESISLSFITSFPDASIDLKEVLLINNAPFKGDTLAYLKNIQLETSIQNLLSQKLTIDKFSVSDAVINIKTNKEGVGNYDITHQSQTTQTEPAANTSSNLSLHIEDYGFHNIQFNYIDQKSLISINVKNFNHNGKGTFSSENVLLKTSSSIESFSFSSENLSYIKNAKLLWDANINLDLTSFKVAFEENVAHFNDLILSFHGYVQPTDTGIAMDLDFDSKGSKFKSLLSLVPSAYSSNFADVEANGELNFDGIAKGVYSDTSVPKFNVNINTNNASFHYPDLPKSVSNIYIDTNINNQTGNIDDTQVALKRFDATIDQDTFKASSYISNLTSNPHVKSALKGTINLGNLSNAYPLNLEEKLEGTVVFDLHSEFTQRAIEKELYQNIDNKGSITLKNMKVETDMLPHPMAIQEASLKFTPKDFKLEKFNAKTGTSDLNAKGTLTNLIGFVFGEKELTGEFTIMSNNINAFDLLSETEIADTDNEQKETTSSESIAIKIPKKINITTKVFAKKVRYDNIILSNMRGTMRIKDEKAIFENTSAKLLGGTIALEGNVDTRPTPSVFDFSMALKELDIVESFSTIDLFSSIAPFAKAFNGKMSTSMDLTGSLDNDFFPDMNSLTGDGLSKLQVKEIDPKKSNALSLLENNFSFVDFKKLDMKKIQTAIKFENSAISFQPFKIATYDGVPIKIEGSHSFDNKMNYNLNTQIPVQMLGKEATNLLSGLSDEEVRNMKVPIKINLNGNVNKPNVVPDYSTALKAVSGKVLESQKNKLLKSLTGDSKDKDGNKKESELEKAANSLLKKLF